MNLINPYFKKTINYKFDKYNIQFMVAQSLFSSQVVDNGTQRLLRTLLFEHINNFKKALDLGCGYGPIGIALKKICPESEVHMVDRDALALEYSKANAKLNGITDKIVVYGSLGYDSVKETDFDLIVSNIPAKVGNQVLRHMVKDARFYLAKNGRVVIVVIDAITDYIHNELTSDETIKILYHKAWSGHHVYHYTFTEEAYRENASHLVAFQRGDYKRQEYTFQFQKTNFTIETTFHLPEFDQLSFDTRLLLTNLEKVHENFQKVLIFNPGQGYIPLSVEHKYHPQKIFLVDRDLQALSISKENLIANNYPKDQIEDHHQVGISLKNTKVNAIIGILPEQQNLDVYKLIIEQSNQLLETLGYLILASGSTVITRIEELLSKEPKLQVVKRERNKGRSTILIQKIAVTLHLIET